jgi:hypothetical protein
VKLATQWSHSTSLDAYRRSLELLRKFIILGSSLESRYLRLTSVALKGAETLALDGAACAIDLGQIETALEMLEWGRSLLLSQAGRHKTLLDYVIDSLAREFNEIGAKMEASAMGNGLEDVDPAPNWTIENAVARYF